MIWDELIDHLRDSGHEPEELDFMESYGPFVSRIFPQLAGRHIRCVFGRLRIEGTISFDVYLFPSGGEAEEFCLLVGTGAAWIHAGNLVCHMKPADSEYLIHVVREIAPIR